MGYIEIAVLTNVNGPTSEKIRKKQLQSFFKQKDLQIITQSVT